MLSFFMCYTCRYNLLVEMCSLEKNYKLELTELGICDSAIKFIFHTSVHA